MNTTIQASHYAQGTSRVAEKKVFVPFGVRMHKNWPHSRSAEYCDTRTARGVGAKNVRPNAMNLALVCDWPPHLS